MDYTLDNKNRDKGEGEGENEDNDKNEGNDKGNTIISTLFI